MSTEGHSPNQPPFEFCSITPSIYIGTNACCRTHFKKELLDLGIRADISLEEEELAAPFGVDYFLWLPTPDHHAPTLSQLNLGVNTLDWLVKKQIPAYVHCHLGHGRSPTLVACYLTTQGHSPQAAIKTIKDKRPEIHLTKTQLEAIDHFTRHWQEIS